MAKVDTKPPKSKPIKPNKSSKNGDNHVLLHQRDKGKQGLGLNNKPRKEKKHNHSSTPLKIQSLKSTKKNNGDGNGKQGLNKEPRKEKKHSYITTPIKVSSLKSEKKNNGDSYGKQGLNKEPRKEKKHSYITTPIKVSSLKLEKKNNGDKNGKEGLNKEPRKVKKNSNSTTTLKIPSLKTAKKNYLDKRKKVEDDANDVMEAKPKRKKRVIRIDPYDISNKRLDDGSELAEKTNKKKEEDEGESKKVELSKNAQFRAIKPSPSILSFVEDNLLGRRRNIEIKRAGYNIELSAPLDNIPFSTGSERERIEENLFRNRMDFFAAAKVSSSFPLPDLPEIAFAGRSNVGKSSLLNSLTRQWGVVRTSDKPGHTQTINFFKLGTKLCLVDLPGYGFAYAKEEVKESWEELVKEYVSTRVGLKKVCLLIDTKWGMKPRDYELINLMERSQTRYQVVLTKTDTVFPIDVARRAMQVEETLKENKSAIQPVMMVSSKSGAGIRSLRTILAKVARFVKP